MTKSQAFFILSHIFIDKRHTQEMQRYLSMPSQDVIETYKKEHPLHSHIGEKDYALFTEGMSIFPDGKRLIFTITPPKNGTDTCHINAVFFWYENNKTETKIVSDIILPEKLLSTLNTCIEKNITATVSFNIKCNNKTYVLHVCFNKKVEDVIQHDMDVVTAYQSIEKEIKKYH